MYSGIDDNMDIIGYTTDWNNIDFTMVGVAQLDVTASGVIFAGIISNRFGTPFGFTSLGFEPGGNDVVAQVNGTNVAIAGDPRGVGIQVYTFVKSGRLGSIYLDGVFQTSVTLTVEPFGDTGNTTKIGRWFSATQTWKGEIAEARIYETDFSAAQVASLSTDLINKWI